MSDASGGAAGVDQTNGVVSGLQGESDGTAGGEAYGAGDREPDGVGWDGLVEQDRSGAADVDDPIA